MIKIECPMGPSDGCSMNLGGTCMMNCQPCLGMTSEEPRECEGEEPDE